MNGANVKTPVGQLTKPEPGAAIYPCMGAGIAQEMTSRIGSVEHLTSAQVYSSIYIF
jgi:hypothetical protein